MNVRCNTSDRNDSGNSSSLYREIRERILELEFGAFHRLVLVWLGARRYRHIRSLGRRFLRGRRSNAGADFLAVTGGPEHLPIAVQVRYWQTPIQGRTVDEFWGYLLRHGIPSGLLVTNSRFTLGAHRTAAQYPGRPIRLISVSQLAGSMAALGLGVNKRTGQPDDRFFRTLGLLQFASSIVPDVVAPVSNPPSESLNPCEKMADFAQPSPEQPEPRRLVWLGIIAVLLTALLLAARAGGHP